MTEDVLRKIWILAGSIILITLAVIHFTSCSVIYPKHKITNQIIKNKWNSL